MTSALPFLHPGIFDDEIASTIEPVLIEFTAPWCAPCRLMEATLDEVAVELTGRVRIAKVDIDHHPQLAAQFAVEGVPTYIAFKASRPVKRLVGARPKTQLLDELAVLIPQAQRPHSAVSITLSDR